MKRRILCFGDSNTYGSNPRGGRYDEETRWPTRLARLLGEEYAIVEEGFGGRTCVYDDPIEGGYKSGANYLPPCLMSHNPLDLVILMLGTNDAKLRFHLTPMTIGEGMMQLVRLTRLYGADASGNPPKVLVVAPSPVLARVGETHFAEVFGTRSVEITQGLAREYEHLSRLLRCEFLDAGRWAEVSPLDAVHLTAEGHAGLAEGMRQKIMHIFN